MSRERYRVYAEDEFFAAVADVDESILESSPSGIDAPRRRRVASVAVLMGVVGAVVGLVAIDVLAQRGGVRRKAAPLRTARTSVRAATVAALRKTQLRPAQLGRARSSAGRGHVFPAQRPRQRKTQRRLHNRGARAAVDRANATGAPSPLADAPRHGRVAIDVPAGPPLAQPADGRTDRIAVARSSDDLPQRPRAEFGFER